MLKVFRYRLYPTNRQRRVMSEQLELCRYVYNRTLAQRRDLWEQQQQSAGYYDTIKWLPGWKVEKPALKQVHSQVLQDVHLRIDLAFKAFFRRVKAGEAPGYPRFKGQRRYDSIIPIRRDKSV